MSVIVKVPDRDCLAEGSKVTVIVQLVFTASEAGQLLVVKSDDPLTVTPLISKGVSPVLVRVTVCFELEPTLRVPKFNSSSFSPALGLMTVPLKLTSAGLPGKL